MKKYILKMDALWSEKEKWTSKYEWQTNFKHICKPKSVCLSFTFRIKIYFQDIDGKFAQCWAFLYNVYVHAIKIINEKAVLNYFKLHNVIQI